MNGESIGVMKLKQRKLVNYSEMQKQTDKKVMERFKEVPYQLKKGEQNGK